MQLRTFAEIATILGLAVAVLGYLKIEPNALDELPELHQEQAERDVQSVDLAIKEEDYANGDIGLYHQYKAAVSMASTYNKDLALSSVIDNSLKSGDFRIAIMSAKKISSTYSKSSELAKIVEAALKGGENVGFAVIAAELIPSTYSKDVALEKIVRHYNRQPQEAEAATPKTELDIYKEVYRFADSTASMNMSEEDAKEFADTWTKTRSYEDFAYFKEVFRFADSTANMDMSEDDAKDFALAWIAEYSEDEFKVFTSAFAFADSSAGMGMSSKEAEKFAFSKVAEYRIASAAANKPLQPTAQSAAAER